MIKTDWSAIGVISSDISIFEKYRCISCGYECPCTKILRATQKNPKKCINTAKRKEVEQEEKLFKKAV